MAGITTVEQANRFLRERYQVVADSTGAASAEPDKRRLEQRATRARTAAEIDELLIRNRRLSSWRAFVPC